MILKYMIFKNKIKSRTESSSHYIRHTSVHIYNQRVPFVSSIFEKCTALVRKKSVNNRGNLSFFSLFFLFSKMEEQIETQDFPFSPFQQVRVF